MNQFTAVVNLTSDPEPITLGEKECMKLRCADNTFGSKSKTLFFDAIVSGYDVETAGRLEKGNQLVVTGTLQQSEYRAKKGKMKGKMVQQFSIPFAKILQVTRSEKFFAQDGDGTDDGPAEELDTSEPDLGGETEAPTEDSDDSGLDFV